jgi:hypothetical protein
MAVIYHYHNLSPVQAGFHTLLMVPSSSGINLAKDYPETTGSSFSLSARAPSCDQMSL